jgi:hypothetical protein
MDRLYEEDGEQHHRINPEHFNKPSSLSSPSTRRPPLTRTLSAKFTPSLIVKESTGRKRLTRSIVSDGTVDRPALARDYFFDPIVWKESFFAAKSAEERARLRMLVLEGTQQACTDEHYWILHSSGSCKRVPLVIHTHTVENVQLFDFGREEKPAFHLRESRFAGTAHFIYADVVDVGVFMKNEQNCDPLVLVFANPR